MFSLATRPVMEATAACHVPQPRGRKIHAMALPILARMEGVDLLLRGIWNMQPTQPARVVNHTKTGQQDGWCHLMKDQPRSHMERRTLDSRPVVSRKLHHEASRIAHNILVFLSMMPEIMMAAMPTK